jgi:hypothetical protein
MRNEDQAEDKWDDLEGYSDEKLARDKQILRDHFVMLPTALLANAKADKLTPLDIVIYAYCLAKAGPKGHHWWPYDKFSKLIGRPETTIKDAFRQLEAAGHIKRKRVGRRRYVFVLTRVEEDGRIIVKGPRKRVGKAASGADTEYPPPRAVPDITHVQEAA